MGMPTCCLLHNSPEKLEVLSITTSPLTMMQLRHGKASGVVHAVDAREILVLVLLGAQVDHGATP